MKNLIFTFESSEASGVKTPKADAYIELTKKQFENFFDMKNIADEKNLTTVEMYIHGVKWHGEPPPMETSDFVIHKTLGVALKAYVPGQSGQPIKSNWFDWGTMDLMYILGDALVPTLGTEDSPSTMNPESTDKAMELSNAV